MSKNYYLFNPGRMSRKDHTLRFIGAPKDDGSAAKPKYLPIQDIKSLYVFGSIDANSALYNFLGKQRIPVHFFDYYEHYTGSFCPKEYLLAGKVQVEQTRTYLSKKRRLHLAQQFVKGASYNILRNLKYYRNRKEGLDPIIEHIEAYRATIGNCEEVAQVMGVEGNCRQMYYQAFELIINDFEMNGRHKQPPSNEVNALISFGNIMCYTLALDMIYHTQLNPTISFLHEPGVRRYSLALDLAEIFKPIFVDRLIFTLLNRRQLQGKHFEQKMNACLLNEKGKRIFIAAFEDKMKETIKLPHLNRKVSYKRLVQLECYKISKYILRMEDAYEPLKMLW